MSGKRKKPNGLSKGFEEYLEVIAPILGGLSAVGTAHTAFNNGYGYSSGALAIAGFVAVSSMIEPKIQKHIFNSKNILLAGAFVGAVAVYEHHSFQQSKLAQMNTPPENTITPPQ